MKKKDAFLLGLLMIFAANLALLGVSAGEEISAGEEPLPEYKEITTDYEGSTIGFIYSDEMLTGDARELSTDLAKASIALAAAAYGDSSDRI